MDISWQTRLRESLDRRIDTLQKLRVENGWDDLMAAGAAAIARGGKILLFGNGGSATQASHFAAELVNRFYISRRAFPAIALTTDLAAITSIANDRSPNEIFSRQVEALGIPGDLALGITTSGKSANVLLGLRRAGELGVETAALCGENGGLLSDAGVKTIITVPSQDTPLIQEIHLLILHMLAEYIEKTLPGGTHGPLVQTN